MGLISGRWIDRLALGFARYDAGQRPGRLVLPACQPPLLRNDRRVEQPTSGGKQAQVQSPLPRLPTQPLSTRTARLRLKRFEIAQRFEITMAIAKPLQHTPISKPDVPQHKRGRSLMFLAHHGGVDLTQAPSASRQTKHKHHYHHNQKHSSEHHHNQKHSSEHHHKHHKADSSTPVYDKCLQEAMKLKTRILIEHRDRPTRFRLSVMKRVVIPPVTIPKKLTVRRGSSDLVSGKRVPFTKAMWETQKRTYTKTHRLPVIHECFRV